MKKLMIALLLCCMAVTALAEAKPTPTPLEESAGRLWDSLGESWDAFVDFAGEAGKAASTWMEGASKDFDQFLAENAPEVKQWLDDAGQYFNENVSPELNEAWKILVESAAHIGDYTQAELKSAYEEIRASMKAADASPEVVEAVENMAKAAGVETE